MTYREKMERKSPEAVRARQLANRRRQAASRPVGAERRLVFQPEDLVDVLIHCSDGLVPLDAELKQMLVHEHLTEYIALSLEGTWQDADLGNRPGVPVAIQYRRPPEGGQMVFDAKGQPARRSEVPDSGLKVDVRRDK